MWIKGLWIVEEVWIESFIILFLCLSFFCDLFGREWYFNGNYLVIIVSCTVILPLALMKQLGKSSQTDFYVKLHTPLVLLATSCLHIHIM